jgi:hypothetical protein
MKRTFLLPSCTAVLLVSTIVNILLLERGGLFLNHLRVFGTSAWFFINGCELFLASIVCIFMLLGVRVLYRSILSADKALEYMAGVSAYLNGIGLTIVLAIFIYPSVRLQWYSPFWWFSQLSGN